MAPLAQNPARRSGMMYPSGKNIDLVIFDWDGTLCASLERIIQAMQLAASHCQLPVPTSEAVRHVIGLGLTEALEAVFGQLSELQTHTLQKAYRQAYLQIDLTPSPLFPEARNVLEVLKAQGVLLAVATGKNRQGLDRVMSAHKMHDFFDATCTAEETQSKPAPDMLKVILTELNVHQDRALMIGDTSYDLEMAQSIGMDRVGVSFGSHPADHLLSFEPVAIIDEWPQLLALFDFK